MALRSIKCRNSLARQEFLEFKASSNDSSQFSRSWLCFELLLQFGQFLLHAPVPKDTQAAFRFVPGVFGERLEENLEEHAPITLIESLGERRRIATLPRPCNKQIENLLRLQTSMQPAGNNLVGQFFAKAIRFRQHMDQTALGALNARTK